MSVTTSDSGLYVRAVDDAVASIRSTIRTMGRDRPRYGRDDLSYVRCGDSTWVDGFWSGQLWLAYEISGEDAFLEAAREQRAYFVDRLARTETHDHDLGFLYSLSVVADYKITGDPTARRLGLDAAESLAQRYNERGSFIRAWNPWNARDHGEARSNEGRIIIDTLENLALLFWAAAESGEGRFREIAESHARTSASYLVRDNGSTFHLYDFDPFSGAPIGGGTHQGYSDASCWARGQAWGIHGYGIIYRHTGDPAYLRLAKRIADYAIPRLPADRVCYWDLDLPAQAPRHRDSSAAAIMASGLRQLADLLAGEGERYRQVSEEILQSLVTDYSIPARSQAEGLLLHGASNVPGGIVDTMLPYGDYFYLEALLRACGRHEFYW